MLDSQVRVIADKQVAQITADRKAIPSISFKPLQRTSLMIRTCIYLCTDHLQCENQCLKRIGAARKCDLFASRSHIGRSTCLHRFLAETDEPVLRCPLTGQL
jgi:hypothetical protein